jgi:integrase
MARGDWIDPDAGKISLGEFGKSWLAERTGLSPTTVERYESAFRLQILPGLGDVALADISPGVVRRWHSALLDNGTGWPSAAKAYRLLRAMMNTAVDDGLIRRNPCRIKGAGDDRSPERPTLTVTEIAAVLAKIDRRYRVMVLLAAFTTLRLGELAALRRRDLDLDHGWITVRRGQVELKTGELVVKGPKSDAGKRRVAVPSDLLPSLRSHVSAFAEPGPDGLVFVGSQGGYIRRQNFRRIWVKACKAAGITDVHFHDLRHTCATILLMAGKHPKFVQEMFGHANISITLDTYSHVLPQTDTETAHTLARVILGH